MFPQTDNVTQMSGSARGSAGPLGFDYSVALQPVGRAAGVASRERVTEDCPAVPVSISGTLTSVVVTSTDTPTGWVGRCGHVVPPLGSELPACSSLCLYWCRWTMTSCWRYSKTVTVTI